MSGEIEPPQLVVDLDRSTGALKYGASGFLYGLGNVNIPTVNMLAPLKPQVAAQKPEGGLQHPNGDAFQVADTYKKAGGREIQVYLQDMYSDWPYENLGIAEYLDQVMRMTRAIVAHPNRRMFAYVPLNEPDQIWYNKADKKQDLFDDWKKIYLTIKALDATARIVGPNFSKYDSLVYREFMEFAHANDCLPDVVSWHELDDSFFTHWYARYDDFRSIERALGLTPRELCINEYARKSGDLGIPGKLVQWISRFENSKVDACLAYWTSAGCLNDLVARDTDNEATGGWWLYKWYASMTGTSVLVTPPDANAEGLQGLASLDPKRMQARVLFGGATGSAQVVIRGVDTIPRLSSTVQALVWETQPTGFAPSGGPRLVMQEAYHVTNGQVTIRLTGMLDTSAYQIILSSISEKQEFSTAGGNLYRAEEADLSEDGLFTFVITASDNGFYNVKLRYAALMSEPVATRKLGILLNGEPLPPIPIPATRALDSRAEASFNVFFRTGINRISFQGLAGNGSEPPANRDALTMDWMALSRGSGEVNTYEAEALNNTLGGTVCVMENIAASGGKYVGNIGRGANNYLQFNSVQAAADGEYRMIVSFANAEYRGEHDYNSQIVDRYADICVNDQAPARVFFRNTFTWDKFRTTIVRIRLRAGWNTVRFSNDSAYAPNVDRIQIAAPEMST